MSRFLTSVNMRMNESPKKITSLSRDGALAADRLDDLDRSVELRGLEAALVRLERLDVLKSVDLPRRCGGTYFLLMITAQ